MTTENWLTLAGIVFSGIVGYFIKYAFDKRAQYSSENAKVKRETYREYVEFTLKFLGDIQEQGTDATPKQQKQFIKDMKSFHRKAVLYASPRVINAYSDMLQNSYRGNENSLHIMALMTNVFREMRRDIGLSNRGLRSGGIRLLRPLINDYDIQIRPREIGLLANARVALASTQKNNAKSRGDKE